MASQRLIQYVAGTKNKLPAVYLQCHIKPRANKAREGISSVTDDAVHICVAAIPKDGESNRAVLSVLSKALDVPKSDLQITRGSKSKSKTIAVCGKAVQDGEECVSRLLKKLGEAAGDSIS